MFGVWVFLTSYLSWVAADKSLLSAFVCFWKARIFGRVSESRGSAEFHSVGPGVVAKWAWDVPGSLRLAKRGNGEAASGLELRPGAPPSVVVSTADVAQGPERPVLQVRGSALLGRGGHPARPTLLPLPTCVHHPPPPPLPPPRLRCARDLTNPSVLRGRRCGAGMRSLVE